MAVLKIFQTFPLLNSKLFENWVMVSKTIQTDLQEDI